MGQLITCVFVLAVSLTSHAQVDFASAIDDGLKQQNQAAKDIHIQLAANTENLETVRTVPSTATEAAATAPETATEQVVHISAQEGMGQDDKDFTVQLRPTGRTPAARYFEVAYRVDQVQKAKEKAEKRIASKARKEKQRQARLARNQKKLKKSRSVASVKPSKKLSKKHHKTLETAQNKSEN